ncbi:hypothetical protein [Streptomyces sp. NPDC088794]|uniref:hypothetical protein n=1 Tax=Streptomyces sp. NPDC088794 TaxID=3365902 RepID=UPI00382B2A13
MDSAFVFTPLIEDKPAHDATPVEAALHEMTKDIRSHVAGMVEQFNATYAPPSALTMPRIGSPVPGMKLSLPDPDTFVLLIAANASLRDHRRTVSSRLTLTQTALIRRMLADALAAGPAGKEAADA